MGRFQAFPQGLRLFRPFQAAQNADDLPPLLFQANPAFPPFLQFSELEHLFSEGIHEKARRAEEGGVFDHVSLPFHVSEAVKPFFP